MRGSRRLNAQQEPPGYGQSAFYLGADGVQYFAWQGSGGIEAGELEARKFRDLLGRPQSVLDFGCGGGFLLEVLRRTVPVVCGVEPNPAARESCERMGLEVHASIASLAGRVFDVVVTNHCLEHVPYPIEALREIRSCIDGNGMLVMALPVDDWRRQTNLNVNDNDHHLHTWTPVLIRNSLTEAGFKTESAKVLSYAWPRYWKTLYRMLPPALFDAACWLWGTLARRRQLIVVARPAFSHRNAFKPGAHHVEGQA